MTVRPFPIIIALAAVVALAGCGNTPKAENNTAAVNATRSIQTVNGTLMDMNEADDWQTSESQQQQQTQLEAAKQQIENRLKTQQALKQ